LTEAHYNIQRSFPQDFEPKTRGTAFQIHLAFSRFLLGTYALTNFRSCRTDNAF